jgi:hypothetical protein
VRVADAGMTVVRANSVLRANSDFHPRLRSRSVRGGECQTGARGQDGHCDRGNSRRYRSAGAEHSGMQEPAAGGTIGKKCCHGWLRKSGRCGQQLERSAVSGIPAAPSTGKRGGFIGIWEGADGCGRNEFDFSARPSSNSRSETPRFLTAPCLPRNQSRNAPF